MTVETCVKDTTPTKTVTSPVLDSVTTYQFRAYATNDIGSGPTTAVADYQTITTYGKPSTPARPTLVQNTDKTVSVTFTKPSSTNDGLTTPNLQYTYSIQNSTDSNDYNPITTLLGVANAGSSQNSTASSFVVVFSMDDLKNAAGYSATDSGA